MRETWTREKRRESGGRGKTFPRPLAASRSLARSRAARLARPNRRACSQAQEQMKMSNVLEKGLPYLSSPLVRCVCLCGGGGGIYSVEDHCIQLISAFLYKEV